MKLVVLLACGAVLAGCADTHIRMREQHGQLSVQKSTVPGADYIVSVQNVRDVGYDPNDKAERDGIVLRYLETQCPRARIVGEDVINTGRSLIGYEFKTYQVKVKC